MDVVSPNIDLPSIGYEEIKKCFNDLVGTEYSDLFGFLGTEDSILLILNDADRPTPSKEFLCALEKYFDSRNKDFFDRELGIVIATGTHSEPKERELKDILGPYYEDLRENTYIHRCRENEHVLVGETSYGTSVFLDKEVIGYDKVININSVEPHYFAGYTGGRKSLVPGVCSWETVEENHELALEKESRVLSLENNPVHLDMVEASEIIMEYLDSEFCSINSVCDSSNIYSVCCGEFFDSFNEMVPFANEVFSREINKKYDLVIAEVKEPLNRSLYQSLKGFENGKIALKDKGVLVLVSECRNGIGPKKFYETISEGNDPFEVIDNIETNYSLGEHKSSNLLKFLKNHELFIVSQLEDEKISDCFCRPFEELSDAIGDAKQILGENPSVLKLEDAGNVVPKVIDD